MPFKSLAALAALSVFLTGCSFPKPQIVSSDPSGAVTERDALAGYVDASASFHSIHAVLPKIENAQITEPFLSDVTEGPDKGQMRRFYCVHAEIVGWGGFPIGQPWAIAYIHPEAATAIAKVRGFVGSDGMNSKCEGRALVPFPELVQARERRIAGS